MEKKELTFADLGLSEAMLKAEKEGKVVVTGNRDGATAREFADYIMEKLGEL